MYAVVRIEQHGRRRLAKVLVHERVDVEVLGGVGVVLEPGKELGEVGGHRPIFEQGELFDQSPFFTGSGDDVIGGPGDFCNGCPRAPWNDEGTSCLERCDDR